MTGRMAGLHQQRRQRSFFSGQRRGEGAAARFQPLPRAEERSRSRSRACHMPRNSRSSRP